MAPATVTLATQASGAYTVVEYLGGGAFAMTFKVKKVGDGGPELAMKAIRIEEGPTSVEDAAREIEITRHVRDDWILETFHSKKPSGEVDFSFYVTRLATTQEVWLPEINTFPRLLKFMKDMADELLLLNAKEIIHLDIKPDNIVQRHDDGKFILVNFGLAANKAQEVFVPSRGEPYFTKNI
jgi:serine/threonine protein kinase